jgi:hypothetical protein
MLYAGSAEAPNLRDGPLLPSTRYRYSVSARVAGVWRPQFSGAFTTKPPSPTPAHVSTGNIVLGGAPFFMLFEDGEFCTVTLGPLNSSGHPFLSTYLRMGDNTLAGDGWLCGGFGPSPDRALASSVIHQGCQSRCWWLERDPTRSQGIDPPDRLSLNGSTNADFYRVSAGFNCIRSQQALLNTQLYQEARSDVLRGLRRGGKAVLAVNPLFPILALSGDRVAPSCITPQKLTDRFWIEACAGVKGIGYQTFISLQTTGGVRDFSATKAIQQRASHLKSRLAVWEPTLFGSTVSIRGKSPSLIACAHRYHGVTTVITINIEPTPVIGDVTVPGGGNRSAFSYREDAGVHVDSVKLVHGVIRDRWPAYAVRVYVLA